MKQHIKSRSAVLCIGRVYCDLIFTGINDLATLGREVFAEDLTITAGGGAYISAAHFADLGREVGLLARLGTDALSCSVEKQIKGRSILTSFVEYAADAGPQVTVASVLNEERAFLTRRAGGAEPKTLSQALEWSGARHLHIAEYATLFEIPDLVSRAQAAGLTVSLDPSWDGDLIGRSDFLESCKGIDLFLPNLAEAEAITGQQGIETMLYALKKHFNVVAIKAGVNGAYCLSGSALHHRQAEKVKVLDTTGAGDAFNAGFIDRWLSDRAIEECLASGVAAGTRVVQVIGGALPVGLVQSV